MSSPSVVPDHNDTLYFVMCDYGPAVGRAFVETDPDAADRQTIIAMIAGGQFTKVAEVLEVNRSAGTVRDVTAEILAEVKAHGTTVP